MRSKPITILLIGLSLIFVYGCSQSPTKTVVPTPSPSITRSPSPTISHSPSPTPTPTATPTPSPSPDFPKAFTISGNKILDSKGQEFVFRGVNILDPAWMDSDYFNLNDTYFAKVASWKANIVRIPVHPYPFFHYYSPDQYLIILDKAIAFAAAHKMYSIIDFHSIGFAPEGTYEALIADSSLPWSGHPIYSYTSTELESFWTTIANHYKNDKRVVFYEIFNEPTGRAGNIYDSTAWAQWKSSAEALVDLIRNIDPNSKIIVNGIDYGYDLSFAAGNPISKPNIVYGTHPYPIHYADKSSDEAFGDLKANYPVFATEFGFDPNAAIGTAYKAPVQFGSDLINYLEAK